MFLGASRQRHQPRSLRPSRPGGMTTTQSLKRIKWSQLWAAGDPKLRRPSDMDGARIPACRWNMGHRDIMGGLRLLGHPNIGLERRTAAVLSGK